MYAHAIRTTLTFKSGLNPLHAHKAPTPEPIDDPLPNEHPVPQEDPVPSPKPESNPPVRARQTH